MSATRDALLQTLHDLKRELRDLNQEDRRHQEQIDREYRQIEENGKTVTRICRDIEDIKASAIRLNIELKAE